MNEDRLFVPQSAEPEPARTSTPLFALLGLVALVFVGTLAVTASIRDDRTVSDDDVFTREYIDCQSRELQSLGELDLDCAGTAPWYAERPFASAAVAALAVFLVGGFALMLFRMERQ